MGKIRIKALGDEEAEEKQRKEAQKKKEHKKTTKAPGMKGGERVVSVGPTEEELEKLDLEEKVAKVPEGPQEVEPKKTGKAKFKVSKKQARSNRYSSLRSMIDQKKNYSLSDGMELLLKMQKGKLDETVELHLNTISKGISGQVTLPHGTGKQTKVAIATDQLINDIEKGKIDFDVLVADPTMMPKLAKVAKILGPKGLMPNPKNGTISNKPEEIVKKYEAGQISFRTEANFPIIHLTIGKISFGEKKLEENINTIISAVKKDNIQKVNLKSTRSPGIRLAI